MNLEGTWRLSEAGSDDCIAVAIPGDNYSALQAAGRIPDPFWRDNEPKVQWVADRDWVFSRDFVVDGALLAHRAAYLSFDCIDTFAEILINGKKAGEADNQFRRWRYEVKSLLRPGRNTLEVRIASPRRKAAQAGASGAFDVEPANQNDGSVPGINLIRKSQCSAGWDWGISLPASGIYGPVTLFGADDVVLDSAWCVQRHRAGSCRVDACVRLEPVPGARPGAPVEAVFSFDGEERVVRGSLPRHRGAFELHASFSVESPRLWWPAGYGDQPIYRYSVSVDGQTASHGIGLRTLNVDTREDSSGAAFAIRVNGVPVFAKGADWIPCDARPSHETPGRIRDLLESAVAANMNMLRLWGGGHFESDFFYDECDRLGLLVWHDMMFACMRYPSSRKFIESVAEETRYQVRRLRDHPSIALWCGDNECIASVQPDGAGEAERRRRARRYVRLNGAIGEAVREADPTRLFWPSSPCAGPGDYSYNDGNSGRGDTHYWAVWFSNSKFESYYAHRPRFCSEFGFQSFPSREAMDAFASEEKGDFNVYCPVFDIHQKHHSGNSIIFSMFGNYYRMPRGFAETLYLSQVQQAEAIRTGVEYWRSLRPLCMGTVFWQLDDNWPVSSWSSIEHGGRWKALHAAARRFYAPLATFAFRRAAGKPVEAHLVWDLPEHIDVRVVATLRRIADGSAAGEWTWRERLGKAASRAIALPANVAAPLPDRSCRREGQLEVAPGLRSNECFLLIETDGRTDDGRTFRHTATVALEAWKQCELPESGLRIADVAPAEDGSGCFDVTLSAKAPAFFVWLALEGDPGARFSDNLITVLPGTATVRLRPGKKTDAASLRRRLRATDLRASY